MLRKVITFLLIALSLKQFGKIYPCGIVATMYQSYAIFLDKYANPINPRIIQLNKQYPSAVIATTDLHAGGFFFCIAYQNCLEFFDVGSVVLTKRVVDSFRPMDNPDIRLLENFKIIGKHYMNDCGYLIGEFEDLFLTFTGLATKKK